MKNEAEKFHITSYFLCVGLKSTIYLVFKKCQKIVGNAHQSFPKPEVTASNYSFIPAAQNPKVFSIVHEKTRKCSYLRSWKQLFLWHLNKKKKKEFMRVINQSRLLKVYPRIGDKWDRCSLSSVNLNSCILFSSSASKLLGKKPLRWRRLNTLSEDQLISCSQNLNSFFFFFQRLQTLPDYGDGWSYLKLRTFYHLSTQF